jgi:hypothetical protein
VKPFAIAAILATTLTLAACGDAPETPEPAATIEVTPPVAPAPVTPAPAAPPAVSIELPADATIPGTDTTVREAVDNVQQQVQELQMTDAEKRQAVIDARNQAETVARNAGLNEERIKQAGDAAEAATKTMFGIQ